MRSIVTFISLCMVATSSFAINEEDYFPQYNAWRKSDAGCVFNGQKYKVGELEAMNLTDLRSFEKESGGRASDGYAVMMMCSFVVIPEEEDYPIPNKRKYVWVAY
ncbi:hypothetical protein L1D14_07560 [Vibrio tubiashii]|uniref:hypothetical protein n=1 Tax=Vibrio tubiashii TaxID=29498 RepID=UPI001EFEE9BA|nr:hypothetical protein [Vibrio tubiashii]MCG9576095.1 hypothetical protein [Vibrio tubiashii]